MAEFCSEACVRIGAMCDFCEHYQVEILDEYGEIDYEEHGGCGICSIDNHKTFADSGRNCEDFKCILIKQKEYEVV